MRGDHEKVLLVAALVAAASACGLSAVGTGDALVVTTEEAGAGGAASGASILDGAASNGDGGSGAGSGPDATSVDAQADTGSGVIAFIQSWKLSDSKKSTHAVTITGTKPGDFLAVMVSQNTDTTSTVTTITDDAPGGGNVFVSSGFRGVSTSCNQATELWFARDLKPGATTVTIDMSASSSTDVWLLELAGLAPSGGPDTGKTGAGGNSTTVTAPAVTPSAAPAAVLSVVGSCGTISGVHAGNPFTELRAQRGNDAAYFITSNVAAYGVVFDNSNDGWNGATVAFR